MLAIKFRSVGKKHQRSFRIVVTEKRSKLQGRYIEDLGWFDPKTDKYQVNAEAAKKWITHGEQPTDTIRNLFVKAGVMKGPKIPVHKKAKVKKGEEVPAASATPASSAAAAA